MKRWNQKSIDLLKKQSEQSRNGEVVTDGNGLDSNKKTNSLIVKAGKPGRKRKKDAIAVLINTESRPIEFHISKRRERRS